MPRQAEGNGKGRPSSGDRESRAILSDNREAPESDPGEGREPVYLLGDPSEPESHETLADALEAAKERWVEVNREALEADPLPGQGTEEKVKGNEETEKATARQNPSLPGPSPDEAPAANGGSSQTGGGSASPDTDLSNKVPGPGPPDGKTPPDASVGSVLQRQVAVRYQSFAMGLLNPHQARPILDVFV